MSKLVWSALICAVLVMWCAGAVLAEGCCASPASSGAGATAVPDNVLTAQEQAAGWKMLFDGKSFDGWGCTDKALPGWSIKDGVITLAGNGGGYLYTNKQFTNFEFRIDFMVDTHTNSGVFLRWADLGDPVQTGFEMQVLDSAGKNPPDKHDCGALYDILAPSENTMKPAHEWNTAVITCRGSFVTIALNGTRIVRADLNKYTQPGKSVDGSDNKYSKALKDWSHTGHFGLQAHGGATWYKNIKIRELK
jgi:hypothetical protein